MMYAIIRLRSTVNTKPDIKETLKLLRLNRINHCVVLEENVHNRGMIQKIKDYVAWGEITPEALAFLMEKRGRLEGGDRLSDEFIKTNTSYNSIETLARAIYSGEASLKDVNTIKPLFRLHPPRKGHKGIKKGVAEGGVLGYHGGGINDLLQKMR